MTFLEFAQAHGLIIDQLEHGRITRCKTEDHPHKRNGAFLYHGDFGWAQNWACHESPQIWFDDKPRTPADTAAMRKRIDAISEAAKKDRERSRQRAAGKAKWILSQCELSTHAYLDGKNFPKLQANVWRRENEPPLLVVPMMYRGEVCGCQLIDINGGKKFLFGQRTNDAVFRIGQGEQQFVCEGYASGLSLHALLTAIKINSSIFVCFSAGNALLVAKTLPGAFFITDNDASGTGERVARESGNRWWMPEVVGEDVNDWHKRLGLFAASQELKKVLAKFR